MDFAGKNLTERKLGYYLTSGSEESSNRAIAMKAMNLRFFLLIENRLELCCQSEKQWEFSKA